MDKATTLRVYSDLQHAYASLRTAVTDLVTSGQTGLAIEVREAAERVELLLGQVEVYAYTSASQ